MKSNIFGAFIGIGLIVFGLTGMAGCCGGDEANVQTTSVSATSDHGNAIKYAESKGKLEFVMNAESHGNQGHIMYDIDRGTVTCIEHYKREELACWKNGKQPVINGEERTSYQ